MLEVFRDAFALSAEMPVLQGYREIASAVGSSDIVPVVDAAVRRIDGVARWYFYECQVDSAQKTAPGEIRALAFRHEDGIDEMVGNYVNRFVYSDPLNVVLADLDSVQDGVAISVTPADIPDALYRERYMEALGIQQRLSFVHRLEDSYCVMNISRTVSHGLLEERALAQFGALSMLVFPALNRHLELSAGASSLSVLAIDDIEHSIARRFPALTPREVQVVARTLIGRSTKSIARDLAIGAETVSTYRKRAYLRIGCNSIEQLSKAIVN